MDLNEYSKAEAGAQFSRLSPPVLRLGVEKAVVDLLGAPAEVAA